MGAVNAPFCFAKLINSYQRELSVGGTMNGTQVIRTAKAGVQFNKASEAISYATTLARRELSAAVASNGHQLIAVPSPQKSNSPRIHTK